MPYISLAGQLFGLSYACRGCLTHRSSEVWPEEVAMRTSLKHLETDIDGNVCWNRNRWLPFIVCRPKKTNFRLPFPFSANKGKFAVSVFFRSVFLIYIHIKWIGSICCRFKWKTEALAKFLNPFTVCSSCPFMVIDLRYSACKWSNYAKWINFFRPRWARTHRFITLLHCRKSKRAVV
jgi:hypothetical protein